MPLIRSDHELPAGNNARTLHATTFPESVASTDEEMHIQGRIRNGKKLLTGAAVIMSFLLIGSSLVTTMLIPAAEFLENGDANGRAISYLTHIYFGEIFGTVYDASTILILWFAGASAMAGLLNIVPRYLPRYGMAPDWARATRPLVLVFTVIGFAVTLLFQGRRRFTGRSLCDRCACADDVRGCRCHYLGMA